MKMGEPDFNRLGRRITDSESFHMTQEFVNVDLGVSQRPFERVAIDGVVEWEDDRAAVGMLHLEVAASAMSFHEAQTLQSVLNLSARQQRQFHSANSTT